MKVWIKDLQNIADQKVIPIDIKQIIIENNVFVNRLENIVGEIIFFYNDEDKLSIHYNLDGQMICPDSLTLEDVEVDFDIEDEDLVTVKEDEDGFYLLDGLELNDFVSYIILPEVPISVEKKGETMYYSGDGWTILTEEEYNKASKGKIDPRLAKILEFKEED